VRAAKGNAGSATFVAVSVLATEEETRLVVGQRDEGGAPAGPIQTGEPADGLRGSYVEERGSLRWMGDGGAIVYPSAHSDGDGLMGLVSGGKGGLRCIVDEGRDILLQHLHQIRPS
jgi:hypothetical protein